MRRYHRLESSGSVGRRRSVEVVVDVDVGIEQVLAVARHVQLVEDEVLDGLLERRLADEDGAVDAAVGHHQFHVLDAARHPHQRLVAARAQSLSVEQPQQHHLPLPDHIVHRFHGYTNLVSMVNLTLPYLILPNLT